MDESRSVKFLGLLRVLLRHGVDFFVVGGVAAQLEGAPILTLGDFDWGKPAPGAWVTWDPDDPSRQRRWDPETARVVRAYV